MQLDSISDSVRVGLIGCGNVSRQYLQNIAGLPELKVVACADIIPERANAIAHEFGIGEVLTVDDLINYPDVEIVVNLTLPHAHAAISLQAIAAGKHVYSEKPLALSLTAARNILCEAEDRGLTVGCAPDTFMGAGIQTCLELIERGEIGTPISVNAFVMNGGPERFHPSPEFLYLNGAGPLFDIGPYYVSALVELFGPVTKVGGLGSAARNTRTILVGDRVGTSFGVETPTHVTSLLRFGSGVLATFVTSFDVVHTQTPRLEIHGTEGSIVAPAANSWAGPVLLRRAGDDDYAEAPLNNSRREGGYLGMGLVEMARAVRAGRQPIASGRRGFHVLEVLIAIRDSIDLGGRFSDIPLAIAQESSELTGQAAL
jgi:predicted dehydrogenase